MTDDQKIAIIAAVFGTLWGVVQVGVALLLECRPTPSVYPPGTWEEHLPPRKDANGKYEA